MTTTHAVEAPFFRGTLATRFIFPAQGKVTASEECGSGKRLLARHNTSEAGKDGRDNLHPGKLSATPESRHDALSAFGGCIDRTRGTRKSFQGVCAQMQGACARPPGGRKVDFCRSGGANG